MSTEEVAKIEADLLRRLGEGLSTAHFGDSATAEDVRAFLLRTFNDLRAVALMMAGNAEPRQGAVVIAFPTNPNSRSGE